MDTTSQFGPGGLRGVVASLGLVALILGGIFGSALASSFAPGAEVLAGVLLALAMAGFALLFWQMMPFLQVTSRPARMVRAGLAMLIALPCAVFLASIAVLVLSDPATSLARPQDVLELALFMVRMATFHMGIITLPIALLAGAATVYR